MTEITRNGAERLTIDVQQRLDAARVTWLAKAMAESHGFSTIYVYEIAISVSELATNLLLHTGCGGRLTLAVVQRGGVLGMEVVAEDDGPGIADLAVALRNGYSTAGTLGGGLPGVQRLMHELEITTRAGHSTRVMARKWRSCK
jgi:serine/threonine-protein kinase RsbT